MPSPARRACADRLPSRASARSRTASATGTAERIREVPSRGLRAGDDHGTLGLIFYWANRATEGLSPTAILVALAGRSTMFRLLLDKTARNDGSGLACSPGQRNEPGVRSERFSPSAASADAARPFEQVPDVRRGSFIHATRDARPFRRCAGVVANFADQIYSIQRVAPCRACSRGTTTLAGGRRTRGGAASRGCKGAWVSGGGTTMRAGAESPRPTPSTRCISTEWRRWAFASLGACRWPLPTTRAIANSRTLAR